MKRYSSADLGSKAWVELHGSTVVLTVQGDHSVMLGTAEASTLSGELEAFSGQPANDRNLPNTEASRSVTVKASSIPLAGGDKTPIALTVFGVAESPSVALTSGQAWQLSAALNAALAEYWHGLILESRAGDA